MSLRETLSFSRLVYFCAFYGDVVAPLVVMIPVSQSGRSCALETPS